MITIGRYLVNLFSKLKGRQACVPMSPLYRQVFTALKYYRRTGEPGTPEPELISQRNKRRHIRLCQGHPDVPVYRDTPPPVPLFTVVRTPRLLKRDLINEWHVEDRRTPTPVDLFTCVLSTFCRQPKRVPFSLIKVRIGVAHCHHKSRDVPVLQRAPRDNDIILPPPGVYVTVVMFRQTFRIDTNCDSLPPRSPIYASE